MRKNESQYIWPITIFSILSYCVFGILIFCCVLFIGVYIVRDEWLQAVFLGLVAILVLLFFLAFFKFIIIENDGVCLAGITKYGFAIKINYDEIKSVKIKVKQEEGEHACTILGNEVDTLVIQTKDKKFLYPIRMYNQKQRQKILEIFSHK